MPHGSEDRNHFSLDQLPRSQQLSQDGSSLSCLLHWKIIRNDAIDLVFITDLLLRGKKTEWWLINKNGVLVDIETPMKRNKLPFAHNDERHKDLVISTTDDGPDSS